MRIAIVGSRRWKNKAMIEEIVRELPKDTVVVSGGCSGPDTWAVNAAVGQGLTVRVHRPDMTGVSSYMDPKQNKKPI